MSRALVPGRYRATLTAVDRAHHRSRPRTVSFTVLRAAAQPPPGTSPSPSPGGDRFPSPSTTGVPTGWTPAQTRSTDMTVNTAGAVVQDVRFAAGADLIIDAPGVTVRRVELQGGMIVTEHPGVVIEDSTFDRAGPIGSGAEGAVSYCGYTAVRVLMWQRPEGFRSGCSAPVVVRDSFVNITPPDTCGDWHGDGLQGYTGGPVSVSNSVFDFHEHYPAGSFCGGTAPIFYPVGQGNTSLDIDHVLVRGGGASFRDGMPGTVTDLQIDNDPGADGSWHFEPINVKCSVIRSWQATVVSVDTATWTTKKKHSQRCDTEDGT